MPKPDDETVLMILTILDLLGKPTPNPEAVVASYRKWQEVLRQRPIK
jgi:hypothetical protein